MDIDMAALRALERDKDIPMEVLVGAMEEAILNAYEKSGTEVKGARVELDTKTGRFAVYAPERDEEGEERPDGARRPLRLLLAPLGEEPRVDRDEGGRERPLAEEVLEGVRDLESRLEGVGGLRIAEVVGKGTFAHEADDAAQQHAGADE